MGDVYVGDIGTEIIIAIKEDISSLTDSLFHVQKNNSKTTEDWAFTVKLDWPSDPDYDPQYPNAFNYLTQEDNLDVAGVYKIQGWVNLGTWSGSINTILLPVKEKFET